MLPDRKKLCLKNNKGLAFLLKPAEGALEPYEIKQIEIVAYNDMWGSYQDTIVLNIAGMVGLIKILV